MPSRPSKQDSSVQPRGEAFVKAVLEAALMQLSEVGLARLSIPGVADLAGVNKTSVYRRWPGKDELVRDALAAAMHHATHAPNTGTLRGDLIELASSVAEFTQSRMGQAIVQVLMSEGSHSELRAIAAQGNPAGLGACAVVKRATERGELKTNVDPSLMLMTIAGAIMHRVFVEQADASGDFIAKVIDLVLDGAGAQQVESS
jgi:AcrR family transcriptional regulator